MVREIVTGRAPSSLAFFIVQHSAGLLVFIHSYFSSFLKIYLHSVPSASDLKRIISRGLEQ